MGKALPVAEQNISNPEVKNEYVPTGSIGLVRKQYEDVLATYFINPKNVHQIWKSCKKDCLKPSTISLIKFLPYIKGEYKMDYLRQVCGSRESFGLLYAQITPTANGCYVENYDEIFVLKLYSGYILNKNIYCIQFYNIFLFLHHTFFYQLF